MTHTTDEDWLRDTFNDIADTPAVDPEADRPVAWHALRRRARQRTQRRIGTAVLAVATVAALVAVVSWPNGDHGPLLHTIKPSSEPRLKVVLTMDTAGAEQPFAYDGHDVWFVRGVAGVSGGGSVVERRDADSGRLLGTTAVNQVSIHSIATDRAGSVWLKGGGGESGEPTVVTRIDAKTGRVVFTHTLATGGCYCGIAAGPDAAWLGGNGVQRVVRIDARTGAVAAEVALPGAVYSVAVVGDRVQVGLDGSRVAVIDPATNRLERVITLGTPSLASGYIVSIEPVSVSPGVWNSWATRSDGYAFSIVGNDHVSGRPAVFLRPIGVVSATLMGHRLWAVGVDQLLFDDVAGKGKRGYANYDRQGATFGPLILRTNRFVPTPSQGVGLNVIIAAGSTLWIAEDGGSRILVVQT